MRNGALPTVILILALASCGYVGPVLPPSPEIPFAIRDLTAVQQGNEIVITFTTPARTVDNLAITRFSNIDLRIGPSTVPFDFDRWAASARPYEIPVPPPGDVDDPEPVRMSKTVPATDWMSKRVAIAVRTAVKKKDHYSSWSNRVIVNVIPPLEPPAVRAESTAKGVLLTWPSLGGSAEYRISRKSATDKAPVQIGVSHEPQYVDASAQYETQYEYTVTAAKGEAESLASKPVTITPVDIFPPSVPASITALAAPNSIEISWQRSPESDLKGYYLYRSVNGGPFERVGELLATPTYSDRNVEHGKNYRYAVSAVDQKNNTSAKSTPAEVNF